MEMSKITKYHLLFVGLNGEKEAQDNFQEVAGCYNQILKCLNSIYIYEHVLVNEYYFIIIKSAFFGLIEDEDVDNDDDDDDAS